MSEEQQLPPTCAWPQFSPSPERQLRTVGADWRSSPGGLKVTSSTMMKAIGSTFLVLTISVQDGGTNGRRCNWRPLQLSFYFVFSTLFFLEMTVAHVQHSSACAELFQILDQVDHLVSSNLCWDLCSGYHTEITPTKVFNLVCYWKTRQGHISTWD